MFAILIIGPLLGCGLILLAVLWAGLTVYIWVASFVSVITGLVLLDAVRRQLSTVYQGTLLGLIVQIIVTSLIFGVIWPALPLILGWSMLSRFHQSRKQADHRTWQRL